jgi:hypothetical protein
MQGEILPAVRNSFPMVAVVEGFADLPIPALIAREGDRAAQRFIEFFTANIRNPNTRMAYARAVWQFIAWAEERRLPLERINPIFISAYIEQIQQHMSPPSVKQHLAAIRMLFDYLVIGQEREDTRAQGKPGAAAARVYRYIYYSGPSRPGDHRDDGLQLRPSWSRRGDEQGRLLPEWKALVAPAP